MIRVTMTEHTPMMIQAMINMNKKHINYLIDGWISEMRAAGLTPDNMLEVFGLARLKLNKKRCPHDQHRPENGTCIKGPTEYKVCLDCGREFDFKIIR